MRKSESKRRRFATWILCVLLGAIGVSSMSGCIIVEHHHDHWHRW